MGTGAMVPYSNPAGNNQMTPKGVVTPGTGAGGSIGTVPAVPIATGTTATLQTPSQTASQNPLIPAGVSGAMSVPTAGSTSSNAVDSNKQLTDIYGKGIGGDLNNLLNSIGGTDSATLQEYNASLQPGFAQAGANLDASLGAGGVSANSSVAALGNANLQAQDQATVASEDAQLTQSGQNLEASILTGTEHDAMSEVSQSGWTDFGQVLQAGDAVAGAAIKMAGI